MERIKRKQASLFLCFFFCLVAFSQLGDSCNTCDPGVRSPPRAPHTSPPHVSSSPPPHGSGGTPPTSHRTPPSRGRNCSPPPPHTGGGSHGTPPGGGSHDPSTPTPTPVIVSPPSTPTPTPVIVSPPSTPTPVIVSPPITPTPGAVCPPISGGGGSTPTPVVVSPPYSGGGGSTPTPVVVSPPYSGGGGSTPTPVVGSPPMFPIIFPGTPSIPTIPGISIPSPPFDPNSNPFIGTCTYWSTHPGAIWGLMGYFGTLGGAFGMGGGSGFSPNLSLQQALSNTRNDGFGALYREGTASLLNSMANFRFPYTTNQVRDSFVAALRSNKAAAHQARLFKMANEGRLKPRA